MVLCLLAAWLAVCLSLIKGIQSSGKVVYFTGFFSRFIVITIQTSLFNCLQRQYKVGSGFESRPNILDGNGIITMPVSISVPSSGYKEKYR
jgi:hypothetical protein